LWRNREDSLSVISESVQPAVGTRYKPWASQNFWASLEYLFEGGEDTEDHLLLRGAWSYTHGSDWLAQPDTTLFGVPARHYTNLYLDGGKLFLNNDPWLFYGEGRKGYVFSHTPQWQSTAFAYLRSSVEAGDSHINVTDAGIGIEGRLRAHQNRSHGYRSQWYVLLRAGQELANSETDEDFRANLGIGLTF
jgi:hypothetical protein